MNQRFFHRAKVFDTDHEVSISPRAAVDNFLRRNNRHGTLRRRGGEHRGIEKNTLSHNGIVNNGVISNEAHVNTTAIDKLTITSQNSKTRKIYREKK